MWDKKSLWRAKEWRDEEPETACINSNKCSNEQRETNNLKNSKMCGTEEREENNLYNG
jgi:hypothetical protein